MPLFEYACRACGHQFEYLTRADQQPTCPVCAGTALDKQLSVFAVGAAGTAAVGRSASSGAPCSACGDPRGPGACSVH